MALFSTSLGSSAPHNRPRIVRLVAVALPFTGLFAAGYVWHDSASGTASLLATPTTQSSAPARPFLMMRDGVWVTSAPSTVTPPVFSVAEAKVRDNEEVIGVTVGTEHRAYLVSAMSHRPASHVVNDLIGDQPLTMTYCDIARCARAFSGRQPGKPLDIGVAGLDLEGQRLVLKVGDLMYLQESGSPVGQDSKAAAFPYPPHDTVETTWGDWRQRHPNTTLYVGSLSDDRRSSNYACKS